MCLAKNTLTTLAKAIVVILVTLTHSFTHIRGKERDKYIGVSDLVTVPSQSTLTRLGAQYA